MKRHPLVIGLALSAFVLISCSKEEMVGSDSFKITTESTKVRPPEEMGTISGSINPADVNAVIYAWNEQYQAEPVEVTEKDGAFVLNLPALDYYHLTIEYTSPTGDRVTHIHPKVVITQGGNTAVGVIELP